MEVAGIAGTTAEDDVIILIYNKTSMETFKKYIFSGIQ